MVIFTAKIALLLKNIQIKKRVNPILIKIIINMQVRTFGILFLRIKNSTAKLSFLFPKKVVKKMRFSKKLTPLK